MIHFSQNLKVRVTHKGFIHLFCHISSLADGTYHQRLADVHITCGKDIRYVSGMFSRLRCHIGTAVHIDSEGFGHIILTSKESGCDEYQFYIQYKFTSFYRSRRA